VRFLCAASPAEQLFFLVGRRAGEPLAGMRQAESARTTLAWLPKRNDSFRLQCNRWL